MQTKMFFPSCVAFGRPQGLSGGGLCLFFLQSAKQKQLNMACYSTETFVADKPKKEGASCSWRVWYELLKKSCPVDLFCN